jgi:4-amino-4-deoxy-L-arabinose transferase-like glycosyltransferase
MSALLLHPAELLRTPARAVQRRAEPAEQRATARRDLLTITLGGVLFGAAVGSLRGGAQVPIAALKIPLATLLTLAVSAPGFAALAGAFGRRWSFRETLAVALGAGARASLVLFALAPVLWLVIDLGVSHQGVRWLATLAYALAGLSALGFMLHAVGASRGRWATALSFAGLFLIVGAQSAWLLRPFIGDPRDAKIPLFAHGRREGGLIGSLRGAGTESERGSDY